jgi:hypothetical protein
MALTFGFRNFAQAKLGDKRRSTRLAELVDQICRHPGGSLPDKLKEPADLRAFYRLMDRPEVTHTALIASHADQTRRAINALPDGTVVLNLHDATELDYSSKKSLHAELAQIGNGNRLGFICHNSLAVLADSGETLGLLSQILHRRAEVPEKEPLQARRQRESRESRLWVHGVKRSGMVREGIVCVDVSDSLSDTFEYMAYEVNQGRHFLLRAKENRALHEPLCDARGEPLNEERYLFDAVRRLPSRGQRTIQVLASPGRQARKTTVEVSFAKACLALPGKHLGEYPKQPLCLWVVRVWEPHTPEGEEPLEWILLTNVPATNTAQAQQRVDWYERRPIIEEFHKGMKTGCKLEAMQFTTTARLEPAVAVLSAVTTTLLRLRDAARADDADKRAASEVVAPEYVETLAAHYRKRVGPNPTIRVFYIHVARLGGHQNRKCDGFPGWITLWRGWMKLESMVDGYRAAQRKIARECGKS